MTRTRRTLGLAAAALGAVALVTTVAATPASAVEPAGGVVGGSDPVTESVTLNFASFHLAYQPQDKKGAKQGGSIEATFDIAEASAAEPKTGSKAGGDAMPYF
jgi:hypothetical protein